MFFFLVRSDYYICIYFIFDFKRYVKSRLSRNYHYCDGYSIVPPHCKKIKMNLNEVIEKTFFHTSVTRDGQEYFDKNPVVIIDDSKYNPRYNELINFSPTIPLHAGRLGWLKYLDYLAEKKYMGAPRDWSQLIENIANVSYRINNRYYERIFEEIRLSEFDCLPSRFNCIYMADETNIEVWHQKALQQLNLTVLPIYEFKATGRVHYADGEWLEVDIVSDEEYRRVAREYWSGNSCPTASLDLKEILFCGRLTLVKKYDNLTDYKKDK